MDTNILLTFSPEIEQLLGDNGVDLVRELKSKRLDVVRTEAPNPVRTEDNKGTRSAELIILAVGVAAVAVGNAVAEIINALREPAMESIEMTERELVAETDDAGNPLTDYEGKARMTWVEKSIRRELPTRDTEKHTSVSFLGFEFNVRSGDKIRREQQ